MNQPIANMDSRIFNDELMDLRGKLVDTPVQHRIKLTENKQKLIVNLSGYQASKPKDIDLIVMRIEELCAPLGYKVELEAWFDGFNLIDALKDQFYDQAYRLESKYYCSATRHSKDSFFRLSLAARLEKKGFNTLVQADSVVSSQAGALQEVQLKQQVG